MLLEYATDGLKPNIKLAETQTPDGGRLILYEHDKNYCLRLGGEDLMHSSTSASELALGELATEGLKEKAGARVLLGGLGLGYTLKSVLSGIRDDAQVEVAELIPEIVEWNRTFLQPLNGALLDDPRVKVIHGDAYHVIARSPEAHYHAVLLDVDNGPTAMVQKQNSKLYGRKGLGLLAKVLKPGGRLAVWSARQDLAFAQKLAEAGFSVEVVPTKAYPSAKRPTVTIYVAEK